MAIPLDKVDKYIDRYGETVTIRIRADKTYSKYGDQTDTSSTITAKAVYNVYSEMGEYQKEGIFKIGDKTFFFKHDQTNMTTGNEIARADGSIYEMEDIIDPGLYGNTYVYEVKVNRV